MSAEVDQSGKIEWTKRPTVIALANSIQATVFISSREKRKLHLALKAQFPKRSAINIHVRSFAILLFFLLREYIDSLHRVTIDIEYEGHERIIKQHLLNLFRINDQKVYADQIIFARVGKKSPAHKAAIETFRGKRVPTIRVNADDILREF